MFLMPPTKQEVIFALEALRNIERPYGDNEGDSINSVTVLPYLSNQDQSFVHQAMDLTIRYTRKPGNEGYEPNKRSITELNKSGYNTYLGPDQYEYNRFVGYVEVGEWRLDISDPSRQGSQDW